jgi:hypothetical protein
MGHVTRDGPAHKIKPHGARYWLAYIARLCEAFLMMKEDLIGYAKISYSL